MAGERKPEKVARVMGTPEAEGREDFKVGVAHLEEIDVDKNRLLNVMPKRKLFQETSFHSLQ